VRDPQLAPPQKKYGILGFMEDIEMKISKNIPIPEDKMRRQYPYKEMEIGDSFYIEDLGLPVVCNNNYRYGKKLGMKFIARKEREGVRVWRTA
jgi:hypothetical protein